MRVSYRHNDWELAFSNPHDIDNRPIFGFGIHICSCFGLVSPLQYWHGIFSSTALSKMVNSTFNQQPNQLFPAVCLKHRPIQGVPYFQMIELRGFDAVCIVHRLLMLRSANFTRSTDGGQPGGTSFLHPTYLVFAMSPAYLKALMPPLPCGQAQRSTPSYLIHL